MYYNYDLKYPDVCMAVGIDTDTEQGCEGEVHKPINGELVLIATVQADTEDKCVKECERIAEASARGNCRLNLMGSKANATY